MTNDPSRQTERKEKDDLDVDDLDTVAGGGGPSREETCSGETGVAASAACHETEHLTI
jgi:hypothetical protein